MEKILLVSDGIIVLVAQDPEVEQESTSMNIKVTEYGAEVWIQNTTICLPAAVLEHLEQAEGTTIFFYESDPYTPLATYRGSVTLDRDEVLKVKGAWEYQANGKPGIG